MKIGIDIGGSHMGVGLVNEKYEIIEKVEKDWTKEQQLNLHNIISKEIIESITVILKNNNIEKIDSIGIGFPQRKIVNGIVYIEEKKLDLISILEKTFKTNVYVRNDVKCSAICEKTIGNLKDYNNCFFMTLGTGIGGAYFYKNELVVPNKYPGFEIGHMIIELDGLKCRCGKKGCFEEYASMRRFRKKIGDLFSIEEVTSDIVLDIINKKEKEQEVNEIIEDYLNYLTIGICNVINILDPDAICIGGSFTYYAPIFMDRLKEKINTHFINREIPDILVAKYANEAGIIGSSMIQSN